MPREVKDLHLNIAIGTMVMLISSIFLGGFYIATWKTSIEDKIKNGDERNQTELGSSMQMENIQIQDLKDQIKDLRDRQNRYNWKR